MTRMTLPPKNDPPDIMENRTKILLPNQPRPHRLTEILPEHQGAPLIQMQGLAEARGGD